MIDNMSDAEKALLAAIDRNNHWQPLINAGPIGTVLHHGQARQARGSEPLRVRITGRAKEWKRDPSRWYVPVKHGMYENGRIGSPGEGTVVLPFAWYLSASEADMAWHNAQARGEA